MSDRTTLVLVPPEDAGGVAPETVLLGLPIIRRTALAARRAGFRRVVVVDATPSIRTALAGTAAELLAGDSAVISDGLRLPWNRIVQTSDLTETPAGRDAGEIGITADSPVDLKRAEERLLRGLIKDSEGFMSRHVERKISLAVSRRIVHTRVTPNQMTLFSVGIGLVGSLFFLSPRAPLQTVGAILFLLHSILDGCDGELARLKFQESRWGGLLDFWGDNVVHVAVFSAIAIGWSRSLGRTWPLLLGAAAAAGTLASAFFVYSQTMAAPKEGPLFTSVVKSRQTRLSRVADALSRRDFIYLVLILSAFGKAQWFLVLAAIGAPLFFLALVGVAWNERGSRRA